MLAGALLLAACSPDDYELGGAQYDASQLTPPDAYTVAIDGNRVALKANTPGCQPLWITPNGRSQQQEMNIELPFAGDYEVTYGILSRAGAVYGAPYKFNIAQNDFSLLSNELYFFLADKDFKRGDALPDAATLAQGVSKKWYVNDKDYGLGATGPVMYMCPYDVANNGNFTKDEEAAGVYKPVPFGSANWKPNWDPGFQDWLIPATDPYIDSYMEFSMDAANGCTAKMYRGESGAKGGSTGTEFSGKFNLALADAEHPNISFTDCYAMHNAGFDNVCANYTTEIAIAELTPYQLTLVTKRTNDEGNWYIVWNFVSEEVKATDGACIPKGEAGLIETAQPVLPVFDNLATDLFTIENNGVVYNGSAMTFNLDTDAPYDWMWWNGADGARQWQPLTGGNYTANWAPAAPEGIEDFALTISKASDGTYDYACGDDEGKVTIADGKLTFDKEISILTAQNSFRTVEVKGKQWQVMGCDPGESLTIGVPSSQNTEGATDSYLCAKLVYKKIGGGQTGPVAVPLNDNYSDNVWVEGGGVRLKFWSYGADGDGLFKDADKVKLKKNQTIWCTFKLKDGVIAWANTPKCALIDNNIKTTWNPQCFDLDDAVVVNLGGETRVGLKNTLGTTVKFKDTCLQLAIDWDGYGDGSENYTDMFESVKLEIE